MIDIDTCEPHGIENCPQCRFNPPEVISKSVIKRLDVQSKPDQESDTGEILKDLTDRTKGGKFDSKFELEEIREAFEEDYPIPEELFWDKENETYNTNSEFTMMSEYIHTFIGYEYGYKSATQKSQEEIEGLKAWVKEVADRKNSEIDNIKEWNVKVFRKKDLRIKELEDMLTEETDNHDKTMSKLMDSEKQIEEISNIATDCVELNMENYNESQVEEVNNKMINIFCICDNWTKKQ